MSTKMRLKDGVNQQQRPRVCLLENISPRPHQRLDSNGLFLFPTQTLIFTGVTPLDMFLLTWLVSFQWKSQWQKSKVQPPFVKLSKRSVCFTDQKGVQLLGGCMFCPFFLFKLDWWPVADKLLGLLAKHTTDCQD